jgi:tRNA (guanine37-N1)-methyltransferase
MGDKLCGIIGTHAEGSIGLLEVEPAFRSMGMGRALEAYMINKMLAEGRIPYGHVVVGNDASDTLQKRLDLEVSDGTVSWLFKNNTI